MQSVGNTLRQAREAKGLTLPEIHARTRIPIRSLDAIEADNTAVINSPFLYRSFVRQIAAVVGIDFGVLAPGTQLLAEAMRQPLIPGEGLSALPSVPPLRVSPRKRGRWIASIASLVAMTAACSGVYAGWQAYKADPAKTLSYLRNRLRTANSGRSSVTLVRAPGMPDEASLAHSPDRTLLIPDLVRPDSGFTIRLSAVERTWLSIVADGHTSFTGTLESDETKVLEGHENARIRTGNAGGVNVVFNGREIGTLGPRGQIRTVLFTRDGYQVLEDRAALSPVNWSAESLQLLHPAVLAPRF